jgi:hypothetical protein
VNEVYEIMARADATIQQMPAIIARLQSLRPLHEESLTFSQTLRHLHHQQSQIVQMLSSHNAHLIKVQAHHTYTTLPLLWRRLIELLLVG